MSSKPRISMPQVAVFGDGLRAAFAVYEVDAMIVRGLAGRTGLLRRRGRACAGTPAPAEQSGWRGEGLDNLRYCTGCDGRCIGTERRCVDAALQ
jgi:hypothetical protein